MSGITRRRALASLGSVSLGGLLAACGADGNDGSRQGPTRDGRSPTGQGRGGSSDLEARFDEATTCTQTAEQTEGPFYFDVDSIRSDIREDRKGVPLRLGVRVRDAADCRPRQNAVVDVWHCDATGAYSGFGAGSRGAGGLGRRRDGETYLRGAQVTDGMGIAEFTTVYPGSYPGRTVHVHAKVHIDRETVLTTQFYFDDGVSERVFGREPYASAPGRETFNRADGLYDDRLELSLSAGRPGYVGLITLDVA